MCTPEIQDGRLSPWGQISPPSAAAQSASKMQMSGLGPWWAQARTGGRLAVLFGVCTRHEMLSTAGKLPRLQQHQAHRQSHFLPEHGALMNVTSPGAKSCPCTGLCAGSLSTGAFRARLVCHLFIKKCAKPLPEVQSCFTARL